jgi:predicted DNA-binding antitoxin AbrB/MazE fold protein
MREQIEVIFENGVFRPLRPLPAHIVEHQHFTVTIQDTNGSDKWLADADPSISLETVRQALAKVPGTLASGLA